MLRTGRNELEAGDELTEGSVNPHDILKIKGLRAVQDYMIQEVQRVYRLQGVEINDKHIEVIVRQMLKKVRIEEAGDTEFLSSSSGIPESSIMSRYFLMPVPAGICLPMITFSFNPISGLLTGESL